MCDGQVMQNNYTNSMTKEQIFYAEPEITKLIQLTFSCVNWNGHLTIL